MPRVLSVVLNLSQDLNDVKLGDESIMSYRCLHRLLWPHLFPLWFISKKFSSPGRLAPDSASVRMERGVAFQLAKLLIGG
jgi:hypothetical protein